jgi:hypothetical protein
MLLPDVQFGLGELLGGRFLPRFQIGLQARFRLFDCFAEAPLLLDFVFGGVFLAARRARQPPVMGGLPASVLFGVEFTAFLHDRIRRRVHVDRESRTRSAFTSAKRT